MANKKLFALLVLLTFIVNVFGAIVYRNERSIPSNHRTNREAEASSPSPQLICMNKTPCGWAVYKRSTRQVDYFMRNNCTCPTDSRCIQTDDDISVSAYVYRCQKKSTTEKPPA